MIQAKKIFQDAGIISFFTLLSRITGLFRDSFLASILGSSMSADAFFVAFRIPNIFRRFFGEGAVTVAFIPVFSETLNRKGVVFPCPFNSNNLFSRGIYNSVRHCFS